jgi:hypothetical protein
MLLDERRKVGIDAPTRLGLAGGPAPHGAIGDPEGACQRRLPTLAVERAAGSGDQDVGADHGKTSSV